ncbi:MAG: integration host factor subunit beta [Rickettsiales bacterium]|nr:integration host factor subunit beta [Rickettsiales bacterium]
MTKSQLIRLLYYKNNTLTHPLISKIVDLIIHEISSGILENKSAEIRGFGKFFCKTRKEKILRHPTTGKSIKIAPYKTIGYSYSKSLKM